MSTDASASRFRLLSDGKPSVLTSAPFDCAPIADHLAHVQHYSATRETPRCNCRSQAGSGRVISAGLPPYVRQSHSVLNQREDC